MPAGFITVLSHNNKHLFLQLHADSIRLFEKDSIAPKLIPERGELIETPLSECPQSQLGLTRCPRHWKIMTDEM